MALTVLAFSSPGKKARHGSIFSHPLVSRNCASVNCIYFYPVLVENSELRSVIESGGADIAVDNDRYVPEYDGYVQEFLYH